MGKTWLILKHEFLQTITRKGFLVMAILVPLIGFAAIGIYQIVQTVGTGEKEISNIGFVDETGIFTEVPAENENPVLVPYDVPDQAATDLIAGEIDEYFIIPGDYVETGSIYRFLTEKELEMSYNTRSTMEAFLVDNLLKEQADRQIIERVKNPLGIQTIRLNETGQVAEDQGGFEAFIFPVIFGFLLVATIGATSGYLLQGLGDEKENRIMEILLSSVSPGQLLIGKILGLGGAGLVQMVFWLGSSIIIFRLASSTIGGFFSQIQIPANALVLGIVYYILGYLFFAVIMAGIGAIASTAKEGNQISVIVILPAILPFYVSIIFLRDNPDHVIGTILTLIPITAPMSVFVRMGTTVIPPWELAVSILLLVIGIVGGIWLAAKVFRIFLLMYGKTPNMRDIVRLIRQS